MSADEYVRSIGERRARSSAALRGPGSTLAAVARHELPLGAVLRFGAGADADVRLSGLGRAVEVASTAEGFLVDGEPAGPGSIALGRYTLRLSHQHAPAVVVLDGESPRLLEDVERRWFPVDPALRVRAAFEPDGARMTIASTASGDRAAERAGWLIFAAGGVACRLAAVRLLEPGVSADHLDVYFRDSTSGNESYGMGRYVTVEREGADVIVDFNRAYNPSCALSPFYNCPIPPRENTLAVPIRAGEMTPRMGPSAAHG